MRAAKAAKRARKISQRLEVTVYVYWQLKILQCQVAQASNSILIISGTCCRGVKWAGGGGGEGGNVERKSDVFRVRI